MAVINYQNLPSTSTPLNATNLNNMQLEEVGSNANGYYEKFANGTLIQHGSVVQSANTTNVTINFPVNFVDANYSIDAISWYQWYSASTFTRGDKHVDYVTLYPTYKDGNQWVSSVAETPTIDWKAIGRWK